MFGIPFIAGIFCIPPIFGTLPVFGIFCILFWAERLSPPVAPEGRVTLSASSLGINGSSKPLRSNSSSAPSSSSDEKSSDASDSGALSLIVNVPVPILKPELSEEYSSSEW